MSKVLTDLSYSHLTLCQGTSSGFSDRSDVNTEDGDLSWEDEGPPRSQGHREDGRPHRENRRPPREDERPSREDEDLYIDQGEREEEDMKGGNEEVTSSRPVSVRLPPKPQFQFVQDNQVCDGLYTSNSLLEENILKLSWDKVAI